MKQLGLVLIPLVLGIALGCLSWALFHVGWAVTVAVVLPLFLMRPILAKVRALNQEEYRKKHAQSS